MDSGLLVLSSPGPGPSPGALLPREPLVTIPMGGPTAWLEYSSSTSQASSKGAGAPCSGCEGVESGSCSPVSTQSACRALPLLQGQLFSLTSWSQG